jgi:hypothetical protein
MEQNSQKPNFANGIYLTKKQGKNGDYLELSIKEGDTYKKYVCFLSKKKDKFGNETYVVYNKVKEDLPF